MFAKIDLKLLNHPRAIAAGPAAMGLWTWGVLYVRAMEGEEAIVPDVALRSVWGANGRVTSPWVQKLVDVGLWSRESDGYRILRYQQLNELRSDIESRRERDRSRKGSPKKEDGSSSNSARKVGGDSVGIPALLCSVSVSGSDPEGVQGGAPHATLLPAPPPSSGVRAVAEMPPKRAPGGVSAWDLRARELYVGGVRRGAGAGFVWPDGYGDQGRLNGAVLEFAKSERTGKPLAGPDLAEWVEAAAFDFARDVVRRGKAEFGFGLKYFVSWLTADAANRRQAAEARACP